MHTCANGERPMGKAKTKRKKLHEFTAADDIRYL